MKAKAFVHINTKGVILNNEPVFSGRTKDESELPFDIIFKHLNISYPKYYKMDNLSKLGFLGVELLKQEIDFKSYGSDRIAQLFLNSYSSLDTDVKHQHSLDTHVMPSPAVFVYTLPNIVMGEIAIRNKIYGENLFILADSFSPEKWIDLVRVQFEMGKADAVIGGWIELFENNFDLRLYFIDSNEESGIYEIN